MVIYIKKYRLYLKNNSYLIHIITYEVYMDAKAMKKVSQARNGVQMGKAMEQIIFSANQGNTSVDLNEVIDDSVVKYIESLGYKVETKNKVCTITW